MILIYTIEGSGSHSLLKKLGSDALIRHPGDAVRFDDYDSVHTTYRDPYQIAQTWSKRFNKSLDEVTSIDALAKWAHQWKLWSRFRSSMCVHNLKDIPYRENVRSGPVFPVPAQYIDEAYKWLN